ncbi:hypothetical protein LSM04_000346 [Trypanosoma melophagium]|uniref:uncharacterized protein n=1 Tax=Trypanosoma melophagium TaxID=715481 RepID=UPI00351A5C6D|nr:hypothetical protein LSM04_000346 [Trypanosoma melophagium]
MMPKLPTLNPSGPLDEVKGSTSNPSKKEEKEILAVSTSVISGISSDGCRGWLEKFSIGRSRIGPSNWRRRYFIPASFNTVVSLSYYKDELCRIPVTLLRLDTPDTRIVTRPSLRTHKEATKPGRDICVIYVEHRKDCPE